MPMQQRENLPRRSPLQSSARAGYVLLLTLVLVMIASMALVGASRLAVAKMISADSAEAQLQRRWATLSLQSALLPAAEGLLHKEEQIEHQPLGQTTFTITLDDLPYACIVTDEQAKVNVNALIQKSVGASGGLALVQQNLSDLMAGCPASMHLLLRPSPAIAMDGFVKGIGPGGIASIGPGGAIGSFGDLFDAMPPALLADSDGNPGGSDFVTCWGDGRIHYARASADALALAAGPSLDAARAQRLAQLARQWPTPTLGSCLDALQFAGESRRHVEAALTDQSEVHGLWVVCRDSQRSYYALASQQSGGGAPRICTFNW
jgi:hypothetical protein